MTLGLHVGIGHPDAGDIMAKARPLPSRACGVGHSLPPVLPHHKQGRTPGCSRLGSFLTVSSEDDRLDGEPVQTEGRYD